jgi:predicted nucleotidyltransferase
MATPRIDIPRDRIAEFCRKWRITEFALFGSVLRDDFRPDSDIDVLVTFAPDANIGLLDLVAMREELVALFERDVDILTKRSIEASRNPIRKREILSTAEVIYDVAA